jgi:hypothetical protein
MFTTIQVNLLKGDRIGAINCLTPHPYLPILATGGLENNAKIWSCTGKSPFFSLFNDLNIFINQVYR